MYQPLFWNNCLHTTFTIRTAKNALETAANEESAVIEKARGFIDVLRIELGGQINFKAISVRFSMTNTPFRLSEIWIYPVKSLGGIRLKESPALERGLQYDRRWMVVDDKGVFITQRIHPVLATVDVAIGEDGIKLANRADPSDATLIPFTSHDSIPIEVKVWDDVVTARKVCCEAADWLSRKLGTSVSIVEMTESTSRKIDPRYARVGLEVSFADDLPYLLISEASLTDLNSRLDQEVGMDRFRPNFVISGTHPFAEDDWKSIRIGDVEFQLVKPCERCVVININPETGIKAREPLRTLATYRRVKNHILFGQNLVVLNTGTVYEGDTITLSQP